MLQNEQTKLQALYQVAQAHDQANEQRTRERVIAATASLPRDSSRSPKLVMGFFATFWTWLNGQLASYIGDNTARWPRRWSRPW